MNSTMDSDEEGENESETEIPHNHHKDTEESLPSNKKKRKVIQGHENGETDVNIVKSKSKKHKKKKNKKTKETPVYTE